jgi:hypothetical protein
VRDHQDNPRHEQNLEELAFNEQSIAEAQQPVVLAAHYGPKYKRKPHDQGFDRQQY